jgi:hypothetical protein
MRGRTNFYKYRRGTSLAAIHPKHGCGAFGRLRSPSRCRSSLTMPDIGESS